MTTITIPRADYVQRADDEGRDFYALRTIEAAAAAGWSDDQHMIDVTGERDDDDRTIVFAWVDAGNIAYNTVSPDDDMDGLYPADDLPFTIAVQPFPAGSYIKQRGTTSPTAQRWKVTGYDPNGDLRVRYEGGDHHDAPGSIPAGASDRYEATAPTVTYTVTVRADHTLPAVRDHLMDLGGPVTVTEA